MKPRVRTQRDAEPIGEALGMLPPGIVRRVAHAPFIAGVDPLFAGYHEITETGQYGEYATRSYRTTPHVCYPWHFTSAAERVSAVMLPAPVTPAVVAHELGHVLHEAIDFDCHTPRPVTSYAQTNQWEAFAEAFTAWLCPVEYHDVRHFLLQDEQTLALFEELAR